MMLTKIKHKINHFWRADTWIRPYIFLPLFLISCAKDYSNSAKLTRYNTTDNNSFIFSLDENFEADNINSKADKIHPKMSEAEVKLLTKFLKKQEFCYNDKGDLAFEITSKQEKIYDITFSHLIEQNYKAKPIAPRTYFGRCVR